MGFLSRLSARARPSAAAATSLMPKGLVARHAGPAYREEAAPEEEEQVAPKRVMRARTVRRQETQVPDEGEEEMARAPASPATDEPSEEETMQPLRRAQAAAPEDEEEAPAVRRAAAPPKGKEDEAVQPARFVRRAEEVPLDDTERPLRQPFQSDLEPGATPPHPDLADQQEPSDLQALRRDTAPHSPVRSAGHEMPGRAIAAWDDGAPAPYRSGFGEAGAGAPFETHDAAFLAPPGGAGASAQRPQVIIDQLDVVIHEPAPSRSAARPAADHGRMLRARYLRRL